MYSFKRVKQIALVLLILAVLLSCDAPFGLGSAVDLSKPSLVITNPQVSNTYARSLITISGTASDDLGITKLDLTYNTAQGTPVTVPLTLTADAWSIVLGSGGENPVGDIAEGEQTLLVSAKDAKGNETVKEVIIFVDNKAPTVLVTSPLTVGSVSANLPTQSDSIDFKGEVFDTSPVSDIEVSICKQDGTLLLSKHADGTNTWTTRFVFKGTDKEIELVDKETYSYNVKVTDKAGNFNTYYFHRSGILAIKNSTAIFPSMDEIGKVDQNGAVGASGIITSNLSTVRLSTKDNWGRFQFDANPQIDFYYSNIDPLVSAENNLLAIGTKVSGTIIPPAGTGAIKMDAPDNLIVEIAERDSINTVPVIITTIKDTNNTSVSDNIELKRVGDSVGFTISIKNGTQDLNPAAYAIRITASIDNGTTQTSSWAEFYVDSDAPILTETNIQPTELFRTVAFQLQGQAFHSTELKNILIEQSYNGSVYTVAEDISAPANSKSWVWTSGNLPVGSNGDGLYNYKLTLSTVGGKKTILLRSITLDTSNPTVNISSLSPFSISGTGVYSVNGTTNLQASINDTNGIQEARYALVPTASTATWASATPLPMPYSLEINTKDYNNTALASEYKIWIFAKDKAGNIGQIDFSSNPMATIKIDQGSDKPVIDFINMTASATHLYNNLGTTLVLNGSISDDDGVHKDKILIGVALDANKDGNPDSAFSYAPVSGKPSNSGKTVSFSQNLGSTGLNLSQAYYVLQVKVGDTTYSGTLDTEASTSDYSWNQSNVEKFVIDTAPPTVTIDQAQNQFRSASFTLSGTASDALGISGDSILVNGNPVSVVAGVWSTTVDTNALPEGNNSIPIMATDLSGQYTNTSFAFKKDTTAPLITLTSGLETSLANWQHSQNIALSGTASDPGSTPSLVAKIEYSLNGSTWSTLSGVTAWNGIASVPNGETNTLYLRATDNAGNATLYDSDLITLGTQNLIIKVDDTAPSIAITSPVAYTTGTSGDTNTTINFTGSISDTLPGTLSPTPVTVKMNGADQAGVVFDSGTGTWNWSLAVNTITHSNDGTWSLTFSATDKSGLVTTIARTITVETKKPVVSLNMSASDAVSGKYNGTIPVKASISDDNTLKSVYWQISTSSTAPAYDVAMVKANDTGANVGLGWNQLTGTLNSLNTTWDSSATGTSGDETLYLWLIACDRFGNISLGDNAATPLANSTLTINQDTDIPLITFTNYEPGLYVGELTLKGSVSDDDGAVSAITASIGGSAVTVTVSGSSFSIPMASQGTKTLIMSVTDGTSKSFTFDGKLKVKDGASTIQPSPNMSIIVDTEDPDLTINTAQNQWMGTNFIISGSANDEFGIAGNSVTITVDATTPFTVTPTVTLGAWTTTITTSDIVEGSSKSLTVSTTDGNGRTRQATFQYKFDNTNPDVAVLTDLNAWKTTTAVVVTGTTSDPNVGSSGIKSVEYSTNSTTGSDGSWSAFTVSGGSWNGTVTLPESAANKLYIRATDNAGNISVIDTDTITSGIQPYTVKVDAVNPVLTEALVSLVASPKAYNSDIKFKGTLSGGTSGLPTDMTLKYKKDGVVQSDITIPVATFTGSGYTFAVNASTNADDGSYEFTLEASDIAGNVSTIPYSISVETKKPAVALNMSASDAVSGKYNGTIPVKASISDDNTLKSVYWQISTSAAAPTYDAAKVKENDTGANVGAGWNQATGSLNSLNTTWDSSAVGTSGDATRYLWLIACDRFGNISVGDNAATPLANSTLTINQDTDIPLITFTNYEPGLYVSELTLKGSVSDDDGAVSAITATIGGSAVTVTVSGSSFSIPMTSQGTKTLIMIVTDGTSKSFTFDGKLKVKDGASTIQPSPNMSIIVDTEDPELTINTAQNQWMGTNFTISGSADDEFGINATKVTISGAGFTSFDQALSGSDWSATIPTALISEGSAKSLIVSTTDGNGRTRQATFQYKFDITKPNVAVSPTISDWKGSSSIVITGSSSDGGSGIALVEYSFNNIDWNVLSGTTSWSGNVPVSDGNNTIYIRSRDNSGNYSNVSSNLVKVDLTSPELSITSPSSLVRLNGTLDLSALFSSSDVGGSGVASIKIKIGSSDFTSPDALANYIVDATSLVSGSTYRILTVGDTPFNSLGAGDNLVGTQFIKNATPGTGTGTAVLVPASYSVTIPAATLLALTTGQQYSVNVQATDGVGKTNTVSFPILIDKVAPSVAFSSPAAAAPTTSINKITNIIGTAGDDQALKTTASLVVAIESSDLTTWTSLATFNGSAGNNWSIPLNTETYGVVAYDTDAALGIQITLKVTATDEAGNTSSTTRKFNVDQDGDRPVIKLTNVNTDGTTILKMTSTVFGTLSDDDGAPTLFRVSENGTDWETVTLDGSTWSRDASSGDGTKRLYFEVTDAEGQVFITDLANEPKIQYSSSFSNTFVTYRVDTVTPEMRSDIWVDRATPFDFATNSSTILFTNNMAFGGTSSSFAVSASVTDANGIKDVKVAIPGATGSPFAMTGSFTNAPVLQASDIKKGGEYKIVSIDTTNFATQFGSSLNIVGTEFTASRDGTGLDTGTVAIKAYSTGEIDVSSGVSDGFITMTIEANDNSDLKTTASRTIQIDNTAPTVTHQSPLVGATVNGEISVKGLTDDGLGSGIKSVQWYNEVTDAWTNVSSGTLSWTINFTSANKIETYALAGGGTLIPTGLDAGLYSVPIRMRIEDNAGNILTTDSSNYVFKADPSGDKPKVSVIYPSPVETNRVMGGIIRIFGSSEDDDGVASVWMQIDTNNDGLFDTNDDSAWFNSGNGQQVSGTISWNMSINTANEFNPTGLPQAASTIKEGIRYKIITLGSTPTNFVALGATEATVGKEFTANATVPTGDGTVEALINRIRFRVRARDINTTQVDGSWSPAYVIDIDKNVPKLGSATALHLTQGATDLPYISDMWVKGNWILGGSVEDESGISSIVVSGDVNGTLISQPTWFIKGADLGGGKYNYTLNIPVDTTLASSGTINISIKAIDNSTPNLENTASLSINYDNANPSVSSIQSSGADVSLANPVVQSNSSYTLASTVTEAGSGLSRVAFYFERNVTPDANDRVYNPMVTKDGAANKTLLSGLTMVDGLPRLHVTGASRTSYTLTHASLVGNSNVRKGSLIKIGGIDRLVTNFDSGLGKITWADAVDVTILEAYVAYALVVDNLTIETPNWVGDTLASITNDDGDGMVETIERSGGSYNWSASFDSRNIPDGPIEIHYVAYDKAGNYITGTVVTSVQNNRPMLAAVTLGTDLDGNGSVSATERSSTYSALDGSGKKQAVATVASSAFIAKGLTSVDIDVVGGNGTLQYIFTVGGNPVHTLSTLRNGTEYTASSIDTGTDIITAAGHPFVDGNIVYMDATVLPTETGSLTLAKGIYFIRDRSGDTFKLAKTYNGTTINFLTAGTNIRLSLMSTILVTQANLESVNIGEGSKNFVFKIWDSTEETTPGTDDASSSQWAQLTVPLIVDAVDGVSPKSVISPFFWNTSSDNSLFGNSKANGHIEISGVVDGADPDVSGQISIRGTAYDDQRLSALWMYIDGFTFTGAGLNRTTFDTNADGTAETLSRSYARVATYNPATGLWTGTDQWATNGWKFTVITTTPSNYLDQTGHKISWQLDCNTAKLTNVADLNRIIRFMAEDKRTSPNASSETTNATADITTNNVPSYQVDVVPYIRSISTPKRTTSGLKDSNIRSASGFYSIITGTDASFITVSGFNLNPNAARIVNATIGKGNTAITTSGVGIAYAGAVAPYTTINLSNASTVSGYLELFTNSIRSVNNFNVDDAKGSYVGTDTSNMYNREPDTTVTKNPTLTDDRYLRFFSMKNTTIKNGYYPTMIMNGNSPVFGLINPAGGSGTYYPNTYQPQRIAFNTDGTTLSSEELCGALAWEQMAMAKDTDGRYYHVSQYNYAGEPLNLFYDKYSSLHANSAWAGYVAYATGPSNRAYATGNNAMTFETNALTSTLLDRYQYPKLVVKGASVSSYATVYLSYYDDNTKEIILRDFQIGTNAGSRTTALYSGSGYSQYTNFTENTITPSSTTWNSGRLQVTSSGSKSFDMAVTSDNRIIVVYYDEALSRLILKYTNAAVDGSTPLAAPTWITSDVVFPDYVGQYLSLTLDASNGVHIAAFDSSDADLKYMYLSSYQNDVVTPTLNTYRVDSSFSVGLWPKIAIRSNVPYIAYYNSSEAGSRDSIKLAYAKANIGSITEGVDNNGNTTGNWEYMNVPTISPAQGGTPKFKQVNLDFDSSGKPVLGYLGTNIEFGSWIIE